MKKQRKLIASEIWSTLQIDFGTSDWYCWLGLDVISKVTSTASRSTFRKPSRLVLKVNVDWTSDLAKDACFEVGMINYLHTAEHLI